MSGIYSNKAELVCRDAFGLGHGHRGGVRERSLLASGGATNHHPEGRNRT